MTDHHSKFSDALPELLAQSNDATITLGALLEGLKSHARASLIILFALPNMLPGIPGTSAVTGLPLVYLTLQMMRDRPVSLPDFLASRRLTRQTLVDITARALPYMRRIEALMRPRLEWVIRPRAIGAFALFLSVLIMLPIPFANIMPALSLIVIGLGMMRDDGLYTAAGIGLGIGSVAIVVVIYRTLLIAALSFL
jgi:hypothetical protein